MKLITTNTIKFINENNDNSDNNNDDDDFNRTFYRSGSLC